MMEDIPRVEETVLDGEGRLAMRGVDARGMGQRVIISDTFLVYPSRLQADRKPRCFVFPQVMNLPQDVPSYCGRRADGGGGGDYSRLNFANCIGVADLLYACDLCLLGCFPRMRSQLGQNGHHHRHR